MTAVLFCQLRQGVRTHLNIGHGIWMLASRIWQPWPDGGEALWMNFWIMFITFADRLAWTTTSPSLRLGSIKNPFFVMRETRDHSL
jgi:hypothetical protein